MDSYEHFAKHDKDGDGVLSEKEFIRALRSTYLDPHRLSVEDAASVKDFFASSQGTVSFPQWQSLFVNDEEDEGEEEEEEESGARGRSRGTGGSGGAGGAKEEGWSGARGGEGRSGGGEQFQEGDLVRIVGFDGGDALSVHNGEVANVVNVKGQNLVVKTAVGAKVLEVGYDKVMHARQFRTRDGDEPAEEMTEEKAMRQYFDRYDADGDGKLDRCVLPPPPFSLYHSPHSPCSATLPTLPALATLTPVSPKGVGAAHKWARAHLSYFCKRDNAVLSVHTQPHAGIEHACSITCTHHCTCAHAKCINPHVRTNAFHRQTQIRVNCRNTHIRTVRSELRAMFAKKDGAYVADQAVEEMLADLDEDESDSIDPAEFWREKEGAVDMKLS